MLKSATFFAIRLTRICSQSLHAAIDAAQLRIANNRKHYQTDIASAIVGHSGKDIEGAIESIHIQLPTDAVCESVVNLRKS